MSARSGSVAFVGNAAGRSVIGGHMQAEAFWDIVDRSREGSDGVEAQTETLRAILTGLPAADVAAFDAEFVRRNQELYSWDLWGAAYVLLSGCGNDSFTDFRSWVVAQGRAYFDAVRDDPAKVGDGRLTDGEEVGGAELLANVASEVYTAATDRDLQEDFPDHPNVFDVDEPAGQEWEEERLPELFPGIKPLPWKAGVEDDDVIAEEAVEFLKPDDAQRALMDQILEQAGKLGPVLKDQFEKSFTSAHKECGSCFDLWALSRKLLPPSTPNPIEFPAVVRGRSGPGAAGHILVWHHERTVHAIELAWDEGDHPRPGDVVVAESLS